MEEDALTSNTVLIKKTRRFLYAKQQKERSAHTHAYFMKFDIYCEKNKKNTPHYKKVETEYNYSLGLGVDEFCLYRQKRERGFILFCGRTLAFCYYTQFRKINKYILIL